MPPTTFRGDALKTDGGACKSASPLLPGDDGCCLDPPLLPAVDATAAAKPDTGGGDGVFGREYKPRELAAAWRSAVARIAKVSFRKILNFFCSRFMRKRD